MNTKSIDFSLAMERIRDDKCPVCGGDDLKFENTDSDGYQNIDCRCGECDGEVHAVEGKIKIKNNPHLIGKWPEILQAVLSQKQMLPALIGIDDELDKLIAERLKQ